VKRLRASQLPTAVWYAVGPGFRIPLIVDRRERVVGATPRFARWRGATLESLQTYCRRRGWDLLPSDEEGPKAEFEAFLGQTRGPRG
jgi:hypothetical protein